MTTHGDESPPPYHGSPYGSPPDERTPLRPSRSSPTRACSQPAYEYDKASGSIIRRCAKYISFFIFAIALLRFFHLPPSQRTPSAQPPQGPPVKIAIVGAGPAGIAAAIQLSNEITPYGREIDLVIFERAAVVGGRMAIDVELGRYTQPRARSGDVATGDVFAPGGVLRSRAEKILGIKFDDKWNVGGKKKDIAFFDGNKVITRMTRPYREMDYKQSNSLRLKYGSSFSWAKGLSGSVMKTFEKLLSPKEGVKGVMEMVEAVGVQNEVSTGAVEMLDSNQISDSYRKDVVEQEVRRQFGQGIGEISCMALKMAQMREDQGSRNDGKLEDVFNELLKKSNADVRTLTEVTDVRSAYVNGSRKGWLVESKSAQGNEKTEEVFDKVISAGHWNTTADDYFRLLHITFIISDGELDTRYFGVQQNNLPSQFLIIDNQQLPRELKGVREISRVKDLYGPDLGVQAVHKLYRVISDKPIPGNLISKIGGNGIIRAISLESRGYPLLHPRNEGFKEFKVETGLYQTSIIEEIGSSVDLSWTAGEHVAKLIKKEIEEETKA